jgi:hypothetical protein
MTIHHGFHATMTAQPGKGDAGDLVAGLQPLLAGESQYTDEVPVGGKAAF